MSTIFISIIDGSVNPHAYTCLKSACDEVGVCYDSAVRGKRVWARGETAIQIKELHLIKKVIKK